jgi:hypothetical protein
MSNKTVLDEIREIPADGIFGIIYYSEKLKEIRYMTNTARDLEFLDLLDTLQELVRRKNPEYVRIENC